MRGTTTILRNLAAVFVHLSHSKAKCFLANDGKRLFALVLGKLRDYKYAEKSQILYIIKLQGNLRRVSQDLHERKEYKEPKQ